MNTPPPKRAESRRGLRDGRRLLGVYFVALLVATLTSVALARLPGLSKDASVSIGFYLLLPLWAAYACLFFVSRRPWRTAATYAALASALVLLTRLA